MQSEVQREQVDVFARLGNDEPDDRWALARQLFHHQLHGGFAQGGMFEPDRVSQEIPEGFFVVSLGHGGGLLIGEGDAASSPAHQRVTDQVWPTE